MKTDKNFFKICYKNLYVSLVKKSISYLIISSKKHSLPNNSNSFQTNKCFTVALHRGDRTPRHQVQLPYQAGDAGFKRAVGESEAGADVGAGGAVGLRQVHHRSAHREIL